MKRVSSHEELHLIRCLTWKTCLPGRVQIRELYLVPTTGLERAARGVCFRPEWPEIMGLIVDCSLENQNVYFTSKVMDGYNHRSSMLMWTEIASSYSNQNLAAPSLIRA